MAAQSTEDKLTLNAFLKVLTSGKMNMAKAMGVAGKVFKEHNTSSKLGQLTDAKLVKLGVESKDDRKLALDAFKKAGYVSNIPTNAAARMAKNGKILAVGGAIAESGTSNIGAGPSKLGKKDKKNPKKRKRDDDLNGPLTTISDPSASTSSAYLLGNLDFNESRDEALLLTKTVVVNRAPVMALWATIVAERLGFAREEALSVGACYTEMNAVSKGVSLGIYNEKEREGREAKRAGAQPYVELMGRRIPLYETSTGTWRALSKNEPIEPGPSFSYISRSFRQTLPFVAGAMSLLADAFRTPKELNEKGFALYADFRPDVSAWGQRAEVKCASILEGRRAARGFVDTEAEMKDRNVGEGAKDGLGEVVKYEVVKVEGDRPSKKAKDEYDAVLDAADEIEDFIRNTDS